jgi:ribonuclease T1
MRSRRLAAVVIAAACAASLLAGCGRGGADVAAPSTPAIAASSAGLAPAAATSGLPTVPVSGLPPQAVRTLELIESGGPFPYRKDGAVFSNRERRLPSRPSGFYREYTVPKPGEDDRGPWRIVAGNDGSRFWTSDHYSSFREVVSS